MATRDTGPPQGYIKRPRNQGAPGKIRCFANGEWKDRSEFSGRQLDKFKRSGAPASNSQISCREHTAQVRRELKCEGPCGDWYPIESFSRSTRSHSKQWCLHCTEWQLSVEPGYAPFNPPVPIDEEDELAEVYPIEGGPEPSSQETADRIMNWIEQGGDVETAVPSTMTATGEIPSLLDSPVAELDLLPVALSAANAPRSPANAAPAVPTYASIASTAAETEMLPGLYDRRVVPAAGGGRAASSTLAVQQPPVPRQETTTRAVTRMTPAVSAQETAWVEDEFKALAIYDGGDLTDTATGWARPNGRRTDLMTPRYVANSRGPDTMQPSIQRVTYAEEEDDDSGDEC